MNFNFVIPRLHAFENIAINLTTKRSKQIRSVYVSEDCLSLISQNVPAQDLSNLCLVNKTFYKIHHSEMVLRMKVMQAMKEVFSSRTPPTRRSWEIDHYEGPLKPKVIEGWIEENIREGICQFTITFNPFSEHKNFRIEEELASCIKEVMFDSDCFSSLNHSPCINYELTSYKVTILESTLKESSKRMLRDADIYLSYLLGKKILESASS